MTINKELGFSFYPRHINSDDMAGLLIGEKKVMIMLFGMYGAGFADLDGHRWNVLYMDMSKMPES